MPQSSADMLRAMIDYNYWARDRLLARLPFLPAAFYFAPAELDHGSIHRTLLHALQAEINWRLRIQGLPLGPEIKVEDASQLRQVWLEEETHWRELAAGLSDDEAGREVTYEAWGGERFTDRLWQMVFHVTGHGVQHYAEVALAVTKQGHSPGNLDFMEYVHPGP